MATGFSNKTVKQNKTYVALSRACVTRGNTTAVRKRSLMRAAKAKLSKADSHDCARGSGGYAAAAYPGRFSDVPYGMAPFVLGCNVQPRQGRGRAYNVGKFNLSPDRNYRRARELYTFHTCRSTVIAKVELVEGVYGASCVCTFVT